MNRIKRILSMVLVCVMVLALVPVTTLTVSAAATGTTALFNGNATYLLQERFNLPATLDGDATRVLSGWDVDYRGGDISFDGGAMITDSNAYEKVSMSHQLMKHTGGGLVMESVFTFTTPVDEGFYYEMSGDGKVALRLETVRQTAGGKNCLFAVNGTNTSIVPEKDTEYHLRAEFTGSTVTVWLNGEKIANAVAYLESTSSIDKIEISTSETGIGKIRIKNAYVYVNYTVNESFLGSDVADWWTYANGEVVEVPGAPYSADTKGFALNPTEAVEPSYKADAPRVLVQAKTAADYNWTGGASKVTVTDGASIGGRQNVVAAAGVGNVNDQTIGVLIDGNNFAFEEDDIITYSYDIYLASATYARTWIRDMGDFSPYITIESSDHYVNAGKWTTITKTLTYADLTAAMADGWTTAGKFVVCIRPGVAQTVYLDNFVVKVTKADDNYLSNAATGARVEWTKPLDSWDNNVMYGSNVTSLDYVADPAGTKSSNVLKAVVGTAGAYGVVAVKVTDDFGAPITSLAAGEVVDVSFDFRSSVAQGSSTNGVSLRIGDTSFSNGVNAPTGTAYDMGSLQVAANTWTTIKASYTVPADVSLTTGQTWYIPVRVPTAGTIYMDNFKLAIRNPELSVIAPTWEAQKASDITWRGAASGATVTDSADPSSEGRGNVIKAVVAGGSNDNNVGFLLGNPYQFKEGDILTYSVDVYSATSVNPDVWLRDQTGLSTYKYFDHTITAGKWTTISGSYSYSELLGFSSGFASATKYAIYVRPESAATLYLDNFKVEVFNENKHIVDLVDGARVKYTANSASDLNFANGLASDDATMGAIKMNLNGSGDGTSVGFQFGKNFCFKEGDTFTYSYDIYTETADVYPDFWLRERGSYLAMKTFYHQALTTGTWTTVTGTITYDELIASDADYATASNNWYAYIRLRNSKSATVWVKNFTVAVTRPEYAFGELPSNASLEKKFSALSGSQTFSFDVFVPSTGANGFSAKLGGATFKIADGKFYLGSTEMYTPTNNVWYRIKMVVDGSTAGLYVNGDLKGTASVSGEMTSISFENTTGKQIMIDNVQVAPTFDAADFGDYPTLSDSDIATPSGDLSLGMVSYPMWREGIHYGWDLISPYEHEREPYLGYYTGGSQEVADWNIKWWAEHGFDHVIYPFVRPDLTEAGGQPSFSVRGEELHDGYMNAIYKDKVDFAIMLSNPLASQFTTANEWITNVLPYITEHYFKNPNYKVVDNQLVVYNYDLDGFRDCLTITDEEAGTTTQDGTTEVVSILTALNSKAVDLGYDGVMFIMDTTSMTTDDITNLTAAVSGAVKTLYKWKYTWRSDVVGNITSGITEEYNGANDVVASIPMGFESTPWVQSEIGYLEPSEIETICNTVVAERDSSDPKVVLFTCWDEWGEGHYYSPSANSGFDYLNAVRKTLTNKSAALSGEDQPTDSAKKRMGVLYPEGRQMLKIREDKKETIDASIFTSELGTLTPSSSNYEDRSGCTHNGGIFSRNYKTFNVTSSSQASVWYTAPSGIDYSKVKAIKFVGYAQNSASLVVKFGTNDSDDPFGDTTGDNRFRFSCTNTDPINATSKEYILTPNYPNKIAEAANETIKYIRFNTQQSTSSGGQFHVEKIVFYSDDVPSLGATVYVDEVPATMVSKSLQGTNGTEMLPAYKFLIDNGAKVTWDKAAQKLTATMNGVTAVYQAGMRNIVDESNTVLATAPEGAGAIYQEGNLFVAYDVLLKAFGYTVEVDDSGAINYFSPSYYVTYDNTDYKWEFEKDGDREGWSLASGADRYFLEGGYAATVKDGVMHVRAANTDTSIFKEGLSMPRTKANYFIINLDTDATQLFLRLYDAGTYASGAGWTHIVNIPAVDGPQEIVIDLTQATDRNGAAYTTMGDTITKVRLDPIYGKTGSNYIDSIEFASSLDPFQFKAFSFGENLFDYSAAYWTYSGMNDKNSSTAGGWGATPVVITDGEYTNVFQLKPNDGQTQGFAGITWLKSGTGGELETAVTGKQVRVSFDYKAVGDAYQLRFENRDTTNGRDGEEFIVPATSEWQHFDGFINMDEVESSGRRTYVIRAFRNSSSGDGAILIKDWQIRVLDETTEVNMFTDSGVAIKVISNEDVTATTKVFVSAYDTVNRELNNFTSGSIPNTVTVPSNDSTKTETYPYYYMAPTDATTEIRTYVWDNFEPLSEPFVLTKKAN